MPTLKNTVVLYHADCLDGFGAAWAAWKKFGDRAEYIGVDPETLPKKILIKKEIYAVDISYPIAVQRKLREKNKKLVILDHHASNESATRFFPENVFDNSHSGSVLAWKYFHRSKMIPKLLKYIEDIDLWKWRLPKTREIISSLSLLEYDFKKWSGFAKISETKAGFKKIVKDGNVISAYEQNIVQRLAGRATPVKFKGIKTLAVNSPVLDSEIGNALVKKLPPIGIVWHETSGEIHVSLRSNGSVDVSKIAKKYGGGGHKKASGFGFKAKNGFPWKVIKLLL